MGMSDEATVSVVPTLALIVRLILVIHHRILDIPPGWWKNAGMWHTCTGGITVAVA